MTAGRSFRRLPVQYYGNCVHAGPPQLRDVNTPAAIMDSAIPAATTGLLSRGCGAATRRSGPTPALCPRMRTLAPGRPLEPRPCPAWSKKTARVSGPWGALRRWFAHCNLGATNYRDPPPGLGGGFLFSWQRQRAVSPEADWELPWMPSTPAKHLQRRQSRRRRRSTGGNTTMTTLARPFPSP